MSRRKPLAETMLSKPFHPRERQGRTPAFIRHCLDITSQTSRKDDGVSIVLVVGVQGGYSSAHSSMTTFFGISTAEDDVAIRRSMEEIKTNRKEEGGPCFTDNESFGFERTYGMTTETYRALALAFAEQQEIK